MPISSGKKEQLEMFPGDPYRAFLGLFGELCLLGWRPVRHMGGRLVRSLEPSLGSDEE